jgi:enhancing lycopene biosynthesis protein 2
LVVSKSGSETIEEITNAIFFGIEKRRSYMTKFAVLLAGCGVYDGSEIHEATCVLISIKKHGGDYVCFSLDKPQFHVVNHKTQKPVEEFRNVLVESARISRGEIKNIEEYNPADFDVLIFPGGFGVAKNFFTFAKDGADCDIDEKIQTLILSTHKAGKYIGAMCVATGLLVRAFKGSNIKIKVTGGHDEGLVDAIHQMGGQNVQCKVSEYVIDKENRIVTTPAYNSAKNIYEVFQGSDAMITAIIKFLKH